MASKLWVVVVLLALMVVSDSISFDASAWRLGRLSGANDGYLPFMRTCNGRTGDCIVDYEEELIDSGRRHLAARRRYIGYDALKKNRVPCDKPGQSYYNCNSNARVNPYGRDCNYITHCARKLN